MNNVLKYLADLMGQTLREPKAAARAILDGALPRQSVWLLFLLAISLSGALAQIAVLVNPEATPATGPSPSGFQFAVLVGGSILLVAGLSTMIGKAFGGTGSLPDLVLLMVWHQLVMTVFQAAQTVLSLIAPPFAVMLAFAAVGVTLWLMSNFIAVAHGFRSALSVFWGVLGAFFLFGVLLLPFMPQLAGV